VRTTRASALLAATLAIAACSSAATPAPTAAPSVGPAGSPAGSAAASGAGVRTPVALPPAETTKLTVGLSNNLAINQFLSPLARDLGLFQKYGLTVEVISMAGGAGDVTKGLVSNALQMGIISAGTAMSAALTDSPLISVALDSSALSYSLLGNKDVKTAADLKGKLVAISTLGDVSHAAVLATLARLNLKPTDVTLQNIGNEANRITALIAGSVQAAPVQSVNSAKVIAQGANLLVDLDKDPVKFGIAGLTMTKDFYKKNPNTVLRYLAAMLEAEAVIFTKPALAATAYQNYSQLTAENAKAAIDSCIKIVCNKGLRFTAADFQLNKDVLVALNPDVAKVDIASVIDIGPLDKLKSMGFNDEIQFP
jgi:NitT/TauT family transport system substrate-binding protein